VSNTAYVDKWGAILYGEPCRECGFTWTMEVASMTALMRGLPDSIETLVMGATGSEGLPDLGWNVSGYIAHMTDNTRIWAERLIAVARGSDPRVVPYDPDLLAESRHYNKVGLQGATWSFCFSVESWLGAVEEAEDAKIVIEHSERGAMQLFDVVASNVHDAYHHRWDLTRILQRP
jgi:hypothetical protein